MRLRSHIQWRLHPGHGYLFDCKTGQFFALNRTAEKALQMMEHCADREQMVRHLLATHPDGDKLGQPTLSLLAFCDDLAAFLQLLRDHDLVRAG